MENTSENKWKFFHHNNSETAGTNQTRQTRGPSQSTKICCSRHRHEGANATAQAAAAKPPPGGYLWTNAEEKEEMSHQGKEYSRVSRRQGDWLSPTLADCVPELDKVVCFQRFLQPVIFCGLWMMIIKP